MDYRQEAEASFENLLSSCRETALVAQVPPAEVAYADSDRASLVSTEQGGFVELSIDRPFGSFSDEDQTRLLEAVRELLGVKEGVRIVKLGRGSVYVTLELTQEGAARLISAADSGQLQTQRVTSARSVPAERAAQIATLAEEVVLGVRSFEEVLRSVLDPLNYLIFLEVLRHRIREIPRKQQVGEATRRELERVCQESQNSQSELDD